MALAASQLPAPKKPHREKGSKAAAAQRNLLSAKHATAVLVALLAAALLVSCVGPRAFDGFSLPLREVIGPFDATELFLGLLGAAFMTILRSRSSVPNRTATPSGSPRSARCWSFSGTSRRTIEVARSHESGAAGTQASTSSRASLGGSQRVQQPDVVSPVSSREDSDAPISALSLERDAVFHEQSDFSGVDGSGSSQERAPGGDGSAITSCAPLATRRATLWGACRTPFDLQAEHLLRRVAPMLVSEETVHRLVDVVRSAVSASLPESVVAGFAFGCHHPGAAFGVAVPEVDVCIHIEPVALAQRLHDRGFPHVRQLAPRKLIKVALRATTDMLMSAGFKFRRSGFRDEEPRVTLLAPVSVGISQASMIVDFSINNPTPGRCAALLAEHGKRDPRLTDLMLLVRRWARERGISRSSFGFLPPYAWSLLTVFFLQVHSEPEEASGDVPRILTRRPGELFQGFLRFYADSFDWRTEVASVRLGRRSTTTLKPEARHFAPEPPNAVQQAAPPDPVVFHLCPVIEDPYEPVRNVAASVAATGLARIHEELQRSCRLCDASAPINEFMQPWVPPRDKTGRSQRLTGSRARSATA